MLIDTRSVPATSLALALLDAPAETPANAAAQTPTGEPSKPTSDEASQATIGALSPERVSLAAALPPGRETEEGESGMQAPTTETARQAVIADTDALAPAASMPAVANTSEAASGDPMGATEVTAAMETAAAAIEGEDTLDEGAPVDATDSVTVNSDDTEAALAAEALLDETIEPIAEALATDALPVVDPVAVPATDALTELSEPVIEPTADAVLSARAEADAAEAAAVLASAQTAKTPPPMQDPFAMLGTTIEAGTMQRLTWNATEAFSGTTVPTPVLVSHGAQQGPTLCLTAAVHGDELNGIETVRRIVHNIPPEKLNGTLIGVPIVNMAGFQRHSRYLPDRRDLNRFFPGHPRGSSASRIAYSFFREVIVRCDGLVDLHTGSFHRTNLPQLRADLQNEAVVKLTEGFGSTIILHSEGGVGTLRRAAVEAGIPAVTLEAGEPLRLQDDEVRDSVRGIYTLLETLGMYDKRGIRGGPEPVYYTSEWVRADTGGILFSKIKLGKRIKRDDLLGTVTDPISNEQEEIRSPFSGRVIGMALNQFVMPGFATYHIGIEADDAEEAKQDEDPVMLSHDVAFEPDGIE
ncbi:MAG: succinylglutamate desuccinylase/aspartoacylase family protein [Pseudomonadota bacterium]